MKTFDEMSTRSLKIWIQHLAAFSLLLNGSVLAQDREVSRKSIAEEIQQIVGVDSTGPGYLSRLSEFLEAPVAERKVVGKAIEDLANAVLAGSPPNEFSNLVTTGVTLNDAFIGNQRKKDWKYGSASDRNSLYTLLWSRALSDDTPPDRRSVFAKAAALLAAYENSIQGDTLLVILHNDFERFAKVAQLPAGQTDQLKRILARLAESRDKALSASALVRAAEAGLIKSPAGILPKQTVDREIGALTEEWRILANAPGWSLGLRADAISSAWAMLNLARSHDDPDAQRRVVGLLTEWEAENWPEPIGRWLVEARTVPGVAPSRSRIIGPGASKN